MPWILVVLAIIIYGINHGIYGYYPCAMFYAIYGYYHHEPIYVSIFGQAFAILWSLAREQIPRMFLVISIQNVMFKTNHVTCLA